jgi:hypothetical protein
MHGYQYVKMPNRLIGVKRRRFAVHNRSGVQQKIKEILKNPSLLIWSSSFKTTIYAARDLERVIQRPSAALREDAQSQSNGSTPLALCIRWRLGRIASLLDKSASIWICSRRDAVAA